jgi:uncharacterized membrane protein SpoIIM required for sporulation
MPTESAALRAWLSARAPSWRAASLLAERAAAGTLQPEQAIALSQQYRSLLRDLASARQNMPEVPARQALEALCVRLHALHRPPDPPFSAVLRSFLTTDVARAFRRIRRPLVAVLVVFACASLAGAWLIGRYPELASLFLSEPMIERVESGHLWTEGLFGIAPPAVLSARIFTNNIAVTLITFGFGLMLALGTFYMVTLNGLLLGSTLAFTAEHGLGLALLKFITAHGLVEISVLCLAGAMGVYLGDALAHPGGRRRLEALSSAATEMTPLIVFCIVLLVGCGFIEGYLSPDPAIPFATRIAVGVGYWLLMALVLAGRDAFRRGDSRAEHHS